MANKVLLTSSICFSLCHILAILLSIQLPPAPYIFFVIIGLLTSIWNHLVTSNLIKWFDRITMALGVIITYSIAPARFIYYLMPVVVGSYGIAKKWDSNISHILAHFCITCVNTYILMFGF